MNQALATTGNTGMFFISLRNINLSIYSFLFFLIKANVSFL